MPDDKDYVDWDKIPDWVEWVACDGDLKPWMYPDKSPPVISESKKWWTRPSYDNGSSLKLAIPVNPSAIIGPLPPWRESLRKHPVKEGTK